VEIQRLLPHHRHRLHGSAASRRCSATWRLAEERGMRFVPIEWLGNEDNKNSTCREDQIAVVARYSVVYCSDPRGPPAPG
jgi:hypothetical protein